MEKFKIFLEFMQLIYLNYFVRKHFSRLRARVGRQQQDESVYFLGEAFSIINDIWIKEES